MSKKSRTFLAMSLFLLMLIFVFPIWNISLQAPQYPEGLGMHIWINKITGQKPHDLKNINGLNHYIGMKPIEPHTIAELRMMPYIVGFLILLGLVSLILKSRKILISWVIIFSMIAIVGLIDSYQWEYDYGHNLDPSAPIKVPGMTYQPPLIGTKQLLNIKAKSYPHLGGVFALFSLGLGMAAIIYKAHNKKVKATVLS